jgi:hypothetical protein
MMKKGLRVMGAVMIGLMVSAGAAQASTITFNLNCTITDSNHCGSPFGPFGTVTLTDSSVASNTVDVVVDLISGTTDRLYLNFFNTITDSSSVSGHWAISGGNAGGGSVTADKNYVGPCSYDELDILINPHDAHDPLTFTLSRTDDQGHALNLNADFFNVKDANGLLYAAVSIDGTGRHCGDAGTACVGATESTTAAVPEPGSIMLFGAGLVGFAGTIRRRTKK